MNNKGCIYASQIINDINGLCVATYPGETLASVLQKLCNSSSVIFENTDSITYNSVSNVYSFDVSEDWVRNLFSGLDGIDYDPETGVIGLSYTFANGLSRNSIVQLGQTIGAFSDPAKLLTNTEIPLGDFSLTLNNKTGTGVEQSYISFATGNSTGSSVADIAMSAKDKTSISMSVNNSTGNMEVNYRGNSGVLQGASGYRNSGVGGNFYLANIQGNTTHAAVEVGGVSSQNWLVNGDTLIGMFGTKNTGFGGVLNPLASIHLPGSTTTRIPLLFNDGVAPALNYQEGATWKENNHVYTRLNGVNRQLDNDYNFTPDSFIQNQFDGAQVAANWWIDGHARVNDYFQVGTAGRFKADTGNMLSVVDTSNPILGASLRVNQLQFFNNAVPGSLSSSYIDSAQGDFIGLHTTGSFGNIVLDTVFISQTKHSTWNMGGAFPLVFMGADSDSLDTAQDFVRIRNNGPAGLNLDARRSFLSFSANKENGSPINAITNRGTTTNFARIGLEVSDYTQTLYKGDIVFETVDGTINSGNYTEYLRIKHDGRIIVKSLDTDGTSPATTGTVRMVTCDGTGTLGFQAIPSGGSSSTAISALTAGIATNSIDSANFKQSWNWSTLTGTGLELSSTSTTTGSFTTTHRVLSVLTNGANANTNATTTSGFFGNTHTGTNSTNIALRLASALGTNNYALVIEANEGLVGIGTLTPTELLSIGKNSSVGATIGLYGSTSGRVIIQPAAAAGTWTMTLPTTDGNPNEFLQTDGTGTLTWAAVSGGTQNLQQVLTTGATLTTNNTVDVNGNNFIWDNAVNYTIEASGSTFLKVAGFGSASNGDVLTLVNNVTGEVGWSAGGGGGGVTSFSAGTLSPLFTTNVATATSTPALTFTLSNASANAWFGNNTSGSAAPAFNSAAALTKSDDTNVTLTLGGSPTTALLNATSLTLGWTGTLGVARGGTNIASYTVGDLIYASGTTTLSKLAIGTTGQLLRVNAGATALEYFTPTYISAAVTTLNTLTAATQTFATGTSGTDFNISSATSTHTFNIPSASLTARGLVTTAAQSFEGVKTFNVGVVINESGAASDFRVESDTNANALYVDATNNRVGIFTAAPAHALDITGATRILSGGVGIGTAPTGASPLTIGGSGWTSSGLVMLPSISAAVGSSPSIIGVTGTIIEAGSGTHTIIAGVNISAPSITAGLATVADTASLYISGAPSTTVTGSNNSILVASGTSRFNGDVVTGSANAYSSGGYDIVVRNESTGRLETIEPDVIPINAQSGTSYSLVLTDRGSFVRMNNAASNTLTVPTNASVAFPVGTQVLIYQEGSGQTTISPAGGVTINASDAASKLRVQHSVATLIKIGTNTWVLSGDITV